MSSILNKSVLDSKDYGDPGSVLYRGVQDGNILENSKLSTNDESKNAFYDISGEFLGLDNQFDNKVFLINKSTYNEIISSKTPDYSALRDQSELLNINHTEFQNNCHLILHEGSGASTATTLLWLAHTINNALNDKRYNRGKSTFNQLFRSGYSSALGDVKKKLLPTRDNSYLAKASRYGMIDVLLGHPDPTNNAYFWDGLDFISDFGGKVSVLQHPKFKQYESILIPRYTVNEMIVFWENDDNRRHINIKSKILYESFKIPEALVDDKYQRNKWGLILNDNEHFVGMKYKEFRPKATEDLKSTGMHGGTIFWTTYQTSK